MIVWGMLMMLLDVDSHIKSKSFQHYSRQLCVVKHQTRMDKKLRQLLMGAFTPMRTNRQHMLPLKSHQTVQTGITRINLD